MSTAFFARMERHRKYDPTQHGRNAYKNSRLEKIMIYPDFIGTLRLYNLPEYPAIYKSLFPISNFFLPIVTKIAILTLTNFEEYGRKAGVPLLAIERKNEILEKLKIDQRVVVSELARHYRVTEETIRRDLEKLEREGYATKTYGGAIWGNSTKTDLSYTIRNKTNVEAKNAIAELLVQIIRDGDHIMLDDSSTSLYIAKRLREKRDITAITNSVEIVMVLSDVPSFTVMSTGGRLKPESLAFVGNSAIMMIRNYHVDKTIISCKGVDFSAGITDSSEFHSSTKRTMIDAAKQTILALDHTKFDKISFVGIAALSNVHMVVTDRKPSDPWLRHFEELSILCIYPNSGQ